MSYRSGLLTGVVVTLLVVGSVGAGWWLVANPPGGADKPPPPSIPATVPAPFKEDPQAATVILKPEARGGFQTALIERKPVGRVRVYGGEVVLPPGRAVVVSAPLAGVLKPAGGTEPVAGLAVSKGQPIFQLLPLLDPVGRANLTAAKVDAEGQVEAAREQLRAAEITLERAKKVLAGGAGSKGMVDDAQAQADIAAKAVAAAVARRDLLDKVVGQAEAGTTTPVPVEAPDDAVLRTVSALPGQTVPAGAALFEVVNLDRVWVRVPVYVGDLPDVETHARAAVGPLSARPGDPTRSADPVSAPPAANPATGTADLFYALDNRRWVPGAAVAGSAVFAAGRDHLYNPGQRVAVTLPLKGPADGLTVPWAAVLYDIHGGAWVYEKTGDRSYTRRRVVIRYVVGDTAVLESGPQPGTPVAVATAGAAELFGADTGFSK